MTGTTSRTSHLRRHLRRHLRHGLPAALTLVVAAALAPVSASSAADGRAAPFDLDGDGHGDLAVGTPWGPTQAATVLYGTGVGVTTRGARLFTQDTPGVPGVDEGDDFFGRAVGSGDFDGDGYADLAVGALQEDRAAGQPSQGAVTILRGTSSGVTARGSRVIRASDVDVPDIWGGGLASGDFDGDGYDDLVVTPGYPPDDFHDGGVISRTHKGVTVLYGSRSGLSTTRFKRLTSVEGSGQPNDVDAFGYFVGVGDITGDGKDDLAVSDQFNALLVWHGRAGLLDTRAAESHTGIATIGLALGDFDADGHADLAGNAGFGQEAVAVLEGTASGLDGASRRVLASPRPSDQFNGFGRTLATGDLDGDGDDDLAVGAPDAVVGREDGAGAVAVFSGSGTGLQQTGARWWTQSSAGVPGDAERFDRFGSDLRVVDQGRSTVADLVASAPGENQSGGVTVVYGRKGTGLAGTGAQGFTQSTSGVPGVATRDNEFGTLDQ